MKMRGIVFLVIGILMLGSAAMNASRAPNVSYLVGTFLPGLLCLIAGLTLGQTKKPKPGSRADSDNAGTAAPHLDPAGQSNQENDTRSQSLKFRASLGVGCGILLMFLGSAVAQAKDGGLPAGILISFIGWAWAILGCMNYMRWKGYSGWFGLFGYLFLPGLIVLVCFPNRRNRILQKQGPERVADMEELSKEDHRSGYRFLLGLVPPGMLLVVIFGVQFMLQSSIDSAEWREFARPEIGFLVLMPGTPRPEQNIQETPAGKVELYKFSVEPKGKKELFMIVTIRFPEEVVHTLGGTEKLLELGRADVLTAAQGQLKSERPIVLDGCHGLELEVLPPKGAFIKARIYARKNQIYQVMVHVPIIRLASEDVQKFFDSFKLSAERGA
jgi:hypothetical protein